MRKHTQKREGLYILLKLYPIYSYLFLNISVCLELLPVRHLWILYVPLITRDQMHMNMEYRLAGSFIDVDSDIISVGVITLVHLLLHVLEHHIHRFTLMIGQIEIGGDMTLGNYQSMAG